MNASRVTPFLLATMILIVFVAQTRLLYLFPAPDSSRWWGDETGQMLELRAELTTGHAHIPTALGSSLAITNGMVRGNSWMAALIYGLPALAVSQYFDLVSIGRTITLLLSMLLCYTIYRFLGWLEVSSILALLGILLLISSRSFFFASHAARLDIAAGLSILLFVWYLSRQYERLQMGDWRPTASWYFGYGAIAMFFATLSVHLVTLLGALSLFMFWQFGSFRNARAVASAVGGALAVLALLIAFYALSGAPFSLYSPSLMPNQFQSVASGLPILRPLSRSVQIANILERIHGLWSEAPSVILLTIAATFIALLMKRVAVISERSRFLLRSTVVVLAAWVFLQSPALYYYAHILPIAITALIVIVSSRLRVGQTVLTFSTIALSVVLFLFAVHDILRASTLSETISHDNRDALARCERTIRTTQQPVVLAQNPAIALLEHATGLRLMTAHFLDFPISADAPAITLRRLGIRYIIVYAPGDDEIYSRDYAVLRPLGDSIGTVRLRIPGLFLDAHRDYFQTFRLSVPDTLILYQLAE